MAYEFKLPDLGEGVAEGEIARWLVEVGQEIEEDDPLVEVQTDKTTVEIPSPAGGRVSRILVAEGELVPVGTPLVVIGDGEVAAEPAPPRPRRSRLARGRSAETTERVKATPLVRKIATELGVDLALLAGTGPAGGSPRRTCGARDVLGASRPGRGPGGVSADGASGARSPST